MQPTIEKHGRYNLNDDFNKTEESKMCRIPKSIYSYHHRFALSSVFLRDSDPEITKILREYLAPFTGKHSMKVDLKHYPHSLLPDQILIMHYSEACTN